jgi:hypothetical protein
MWWDNQTLIKETKRALETRHFAGTSLYLGIANTVDDDININNIHADTTFDTKHLRSILKMQDYLEKNKQNGLKYKGKYYDNDSHMSVPLITEYDALHFIFNFYPLKITIKEENNPDPAYLVNKINSHYSYASKQMGYNVYPNEGLLNWNGHKALNKKQHEKAKRLFNYYLAIYPKTADANACMGDYYQAIHDIKNALAYYVKSLTIKENATIRKKVKKMQGK